MPTHHLQSMRNIVAAAIKSGNSTWCRTLATTHEDLASRLRAAAGYKGDGIERKRMSKSNRVPPARFAVALVPIIEQVAKDKGFRRIDAIENYFDLDNKTATRIFKLLATVGKKGGIITYYSKEGKHETEVTPS